MPVVLKPTHLKLTAIIEPSDGVFVAFCPELDLVTEADTADEALIDLFDEVLEYAEDYAEHFEQFSQSVNRAAHADYIEAIRCKPTVEGVRALFED